MHILLTGATGLLGRYLVRDLLLAGVPLAVLIRPRGGESAARRLDQLLGHWDRELGRPLPRPVCLEGDISLPGLGLNTGDRDWVARHCRCLLHNAASLTFSGEDRTQEPWRSNVTGVRNVLDFCHQNGPRQLHHVSTAYVCGRRPGPVLEQELDLGQELRNDYERSKLEAERAVRSADFLDGVTVYRPAVIVGDSRTGFTSTYHGFYTYLQFAWLLVSYLEPGPDGRVHIDFRFNSTGDEPRNLVPVDWVSAAIVHLLLNPRHHGLTYHLTPLQPVTVRQIEAFLSAYLNYTGPVFVGGGGLDELNELEKTFRDHVARYEPYWAQEPVFDCRNTLAALPHLPCPPVDADCLRRLSDFAIRDRWGRSRRRPRTARVGEEQTREARPGAPEG